MMGSALRRWLRSLNVQLVLWAMLPVMFVIIALSFTGVYAHQATMRDFVIARGLALARVTARFVENGLGHGAIGLEGTELPAWLQLIAGDHPGTVMIMDRKGRVLAHLDPSLVSTGIAYLEMVEALNEKEGVVALEGGLPGMQGPALLIFAAVTGTDWVVAVQEPVEELTGSLLRFPSLVPIVAVSAGILSVLVLTFGWLTIVRPLHQLGQAADAVSWGDYSPIARSIGGVQEVRDLRQALAAMVERIRGYQVAIHDYAGETTRAQEEERARLARELHDGPVQDLIALGQRLEMAQRLLKRGGIEGVRAHLRDLHQARQDLVSELRHLISVLRPVYLEDLGFLPALEALVHQVSEGSPARVTLERRGQVGRLAPQLELAAYRIAQEALNNALRHASAGEITVRVQYAPEGLTLAVIDDGVGFMVPERPDELTQTGHFGLVGMQERAALLGGTLHVRSAPGEGAEITADLPGHAPA